MNREQAIRYVEAAENEEEYAYRSGRVYAIIHGEKYRQPLTEWYADLMQRWHGRKATWQCACGRAIAKGHSDEHVKAREAEQCIVCYGQNLCQKCGVRMIAKGKSAGSKAARKKCMCHTCYQRREG